MGGPSKSGQGIHSDTPLSAEDRCPGTLPDGGGVKLLSRFLARSKFLCSGSAAVFLADLSGCCISDLLISDIISPTLLEGFIFGSSVEVEGTLQ